MKILLVKMSSMGDIFHTFPALTDLQRARPGVEVHWVVEDGFREIAAWHGAVTRVIPIALRRWMKQRGRADWRAFVAWRKQLRLEQYDLVIDAQGLLKSALVARCARATRIAGYDSASAREGLAAWFYGHGHVVSRDQHAVARTRQLLSDVLGYSPEPVLRFGLDQQFSTVTRASKHLSFVAGTTWASKLWSLNRWRELAALAASNGYSIEVIWGSSEERALAQQIVQSVPGVSCADERLSLRAVAERLVASTGVVGLDTGFTHLAGALEVPVIGLFGPTSSDKVGLIGAHTRNLQLSPALECMPCHKRLCALNRGAADRTAPCLERVSAEHVFSSLQAVIIASRRPPL